jgi:folate-binding protein YgfZ
MRAESSFMVEVMVFSSVWMVMVRPLGHEGGCGVCRAYCTWVGKTNEANGSQFLTWSRISVHGPDAESFLQGQLTQDLSLVGDAGCWSLLLKPDSAMLTTCFVERDASGFTLTVPRDVADTALARLKRFHLRVNCTLELDDVAEGPITTTQELVTSGWPGVNEFHAELTPQSYGGRLVAETVSFTKGCYTGQELVARLDARGSSVPWRFVRAAGTDEARIDEVLKSKGPAGPQGVTTAVEIDGRVVCLGFAHRTLLDADLLASIEDVTLEAIG